MNAEEHQVTCPSCWETISLVIDPSPGEQRYTEDCSVCCRPMVVIVRALPGGHFAVDVARESD